MKPTAAQRPVPSKTRMTVATASNKYDESRLSARLVVFWGLLMSGFTEDLLWPDNLRTSLVSVAYAVALAAMTLGMLRFVIREGRNYLNPEEPAPRSEAGPTWHDARLFTDPWYQIPAIYCVFVLAGQFALEVIADPPSTRQTLWYLVFVGIMAVVVPISVRRRVTLEIAGPVDGHDGHGAAKPAVSAAFRDPWFTVPTAVLGAVHLTRYGLELLEEDPSSTVAILVFLAPLAAVVVAVAMPSIDTLRRRRKLRDAAGPGSLEVSLDATSLGTGVAVNRSPGAAGRRHGR